MCFLFFSAPCTLFLWGSSVGWTVVFCLLDCCVHTFSAGFRDQLAILGDDPRINKQFLYASQHTVNPSFYLTLPISLSFFSIIISASPSVRLLQHLSFLLSFLSVLLHKKRQSRPKAHLPWLIISPVTRDDFCSSHWLFVCVVYQNVLPSNKQPPN